MVIRATLSNMKIIHKAKKEILRRGVTVFYDLVKPLVDKFDSEEPGIGWRRSSTPHIREEIFSILEYWSLKPDRNGKPKTIIMLVDIFSLIYDTDDAYAEIFHRFVEVCYNGSLQVRPGEKYLVRGRTTDERKEYARKHGLDYDWWDIDPSAGPEHMAQLNEKLKGEEKGI